MGQVCYKTIKLLLTMKVALVRGAYLNNFEGQNYSELSNTVQVTGIASKKPIHSEFSFPVDKLLSLTDFGFPSWIANRTIGDKHYLFGLEKAVKGFDIVHTADPHYYYTYQLAMLRKQGKIKKLIATSWDTIPFNNESVEAKKRIKYFSMKYIDHFICYTNRAKKCLKAEGVNPNKITVIPLGVDLNKFKPTPKVNSRSKSGKLRILFTGRDVVEKGLSDLRTSINQLIEEGDVELLVAGNVQYDRMPEVYRLADIFVIPSKTTKTWEEQYGMSLVEAMASGLPIVAYSSGSIPEILGSVGILVPEGSTRALKKELTNLVASSSKRLRLGNVARKRAENVYDSAAFGRRIKSFYVSVLK